VAYNTKSLPHAVLYIMLLLSICCHTLLHRLRVVCSCLRFMSSDINISGLIVLCCPFRMVFCKPTVFSSMYALKPFLHAWSFSF